MSFSKPLSGVKHQALGPASPSNQSSKPLLEWNLALTPPFFDELATLAKNGGSIAFSSMGQRL